jgi:microcystin degradation protein MlrC
MQRQGFRSVKASITWTLIVKQTIKPQIGIIALLQESNTFIAGRTTLAHFEQDLLVEGEAIRDRFTNSHHEVGGFFAGLAEAGITAVPVFAARALPFGVIDKGTFDTLLDRMQAALDRAVPLDGLLVAPHGATVSASAPDADGSWLARLRQRFPRPFPIIGTLDLHANLSPAMVAACDALIAYRTNPHLDQRDRGREAAALMARTLRGEVQPVMAAAFPPLAVNIECQATAEEPCRSLYALADSMRAQPPVLSASVVLGFPYADVPHMGPSTVVVADGDERLAQRLADELAVNWWQRRAEFTGRLVSVDEAVRRVAELAGPVCLLDMGDNVGGGSPGDGTLLLHALARRQVEPALVCLCDPEAVTQAAAAGVGARLRLRIGGKTDCRHGEPFEADFKVRGLFDGRFHESEPRHGGFTAFDQGPTALIETATRMTVMLTTQRMAPFSLRQLTAFGVEPARFHVLVAKGVHAPTAAYAPVCKHLFRVDTPGVTSADLSRLDYRHRRRPMYPFEPTTTWQPRSIVSRPQGLLPAK